MRGAIIFIAAFVVFLLITIGYSSLPPGQMIYDAVVKAETDYEVVGVPATLLVAAVINGVIYGVIIWLIYTMAERTGLLPRKSKPTTSTTPA